MVSLKEILDWLEHWAPARLAESWDNPGLMVGTSRKEIQKIALALEPSVENIRRARALNAQVLLTHHPLIFKPLKKIDPRTPVGAAIFEAVRADLAVVAAHTNLDAALGGVGWVLARILELEQITVLDPRPHDDLRKLVVFVPAGYENQVRQGLVRIGAGRIGAYTQCSFSGRGQGTFAPPEDTNPFAGLPGRLNRVAESRLEMVIEAHLVGRARIVLAEVHPYEEPAVEVFPLEPEERAGFGCLGLLKTEMSIDGLLELIKEKLEVPGLRTAAVPSGPIRKVAVMPGSGGGYVAAAAAQGAQVLISGDLGYHQARDAEFLGLCLIDAGHFSTEKPVLQEMANRLNNDPVLGGRLDVEVITQEKDPWQVREG